MTRHVKIVLLFVPYSLISLCDTDDKLFTLLAASRLEHRLPEVINTNQTEFLQLERLAENIYHLLKELEFQIGPVLEINRI